MIVEHADLRVDPARLEEFDEAIKRGVAEVLSGSPGYLGHQILKGIESADRYVLLVHWRTVEDHNIGFRESPAFAAWRAIIGPFFAGAPTVEHFDMLDEG